MVATETLESGFLKNEQNTSGRLPFFLLSVALYIRCISCSVRFIFIRPLFRILGEEKVLSENANRSFNKC